MTYAAIPTVYKGVQMRSRLEARWAAFFDFQSDREWQYEPFDLSGWIPDFSWNLKRAWPWDAVSLFEVKPIRLLDYPDGPPSDVASKIERAVGAENKFDLWIIGLDPGTMWRLCRNGWQAQSLDGWRNAWNAAGNAVQWKPPR